ncbi:MAG: FIST C-terminal domain-containing protein [Deltaproteobacteria bacterium]|nr:FIST C-terminal domain-containing protein [Deltaproteobacteria bacterium]
MSENADLSVKRGISFAKDEEQAVRELYDEIYQPDAEVVIFFCSSRYDPDKLGNSIKGRFPCALMGCSTAGEITSGGYHEGSIVGVSLASRALRAHIRPVAPLSRFSAEKAEAMAGSIREELVFSSAFDRNRMFGLLLIDGLSMLEEQTTSFIHSQFEGVSIVGGSSGDDLRFEATRIYADGRFIPDAAVFALFETTLPFHIFKTQHFQPTDLKLVITEADPANRRVLEINGEPAAQEYAEMLGMNIDELSPMVFSNHPLMLSIGGEYYVRSIQKVNEDGSLSFFCAIDNGLVLTVADGIGLAENLQNQLLEIRRHIPNPKLMLGCDCILRRLEIQEKGLINDVCEAIKDSNLIGFSTYGEQFNAIHVNQTLTGVAIGDPE